MDTIHHACNGPYEQSSDLVDVPRKEPVWRVVGGSVAAGLLGASCSRSASFGGAAEHVISGSAPARLRRRLGDARGAVGPLHQPAAAVGTRARRQHGRRRADAADRPARRSARSTWPGGCGRRRRSRSPPGWSSSSGAASPAEFAGCSTRSWRRSPSAPSAGCTRPPSGPHDQHTYAVPGSVLRRRRSPPAPATARERAAPPSCSRTDSAQTSPNWARITAEVSRTTRVCAYDRAGQGWSDDVDAPQDGLAIAADLHTLLAAPAKQGPYVLVGHSAGGTYAMTYAAQYPDEVAGMVLLDSMSPYEFTALPGFAAEQSMMRRGLGVLPSLARLGVDPAAAHVAWSSLPEPAASQVQAFASSPAACATCATSSPCIPRCSSRPRR